MIRITYKLALWFVIVLAPGGFLLLPLALGKPHGERASDAVESA